MKMIPSAVPEISLSLWQYRPKLSMPKASSFDSCLSTDDAAVPFLKL